MSDISDILNGLNIIAGVVDNIADYKLAKDKFESADKTKLELFNRQRQQSMDQLNIKNTLNNLKSQHTAVNKDINDTLSNLETSNQNVEAIVNLNEWLQTGDGKDLAISRVKEDENSLSRQGDIANNIVGTIRSQRDLLTYNNFLKDKLNMLNRTTNKIMDTSKSQMLESGEDALIGMEDFEVLFNTPAFQSEFEDLMGFGFDPATGMGVDDPETPYIDEGAIDVKSLYEKGSRERIEEIGEEFDSKKKQVDFEKSLLALEEKQTEAKLDKLGLTDFWDDTTNIVKFWGQSLSDTREQVSEGYKGAASHDFGTWKGVPKGSINSMYKLNLLKDDMEENIIHALEYGISGWEITPDEIEDLLKGNMTNEARVIAIEELLMPKEGVIAGKGGLDPDIEKQIDFEKGFGVSKASQLDFSNTIRFWRDLLDKRTEYYIKIGELAPEDTTTSYNPMESKYLQEAAGYTPDSSNRKYK